MYRYRFTRFSVCMLFAVCTLLLSSCGTRAPRVDYRELARAAVRLEMDIDADDNHRLYVEVADWIGVPYTTEEPLTGERTVQASHLQSIKKCTTRNCNAIPTPSVRKTAEKYPSAS